MDDFDLLEPMIQVVQSFLASKQAARTTLLSKSWRSAWLTRPNLDFDLAEFCGSNYNCNKLDPEFLEFAVKTLERYENSNLRIHSFRLSIKLVSYSDVFVTLTKLIHRALKLGPTRLTFEFGNYFAFHIPSEVFTHENLVSLTAKQCIIDPNRDEVRCSRLQFLSLENVTIRGLDTKFHIISSCPLIENLTLCNVKVYRTIRNSLVRKHEKLFDTLFLAYLSSKLPSLKDLTLHIIEDQEEILISIPTLERLDLNIREYYESRNTVKVVKLDVPSIRKLNFACSKVPDEVYVTSNSTGWECCVSVTNEKCPDASWFYRMSNFIDKFKFSRISLLSLHVHSKRTFDYEAGDVRDLPTPEIENLTIYDREYMTTKSCYALFDGLFKMCHPKVINIRIVPIYRTNIINFLVKGLLDARDAKVSTRNQFMYGLNEYIKEARAQVFDAAVSTWRDVTLDSLADEEDSTTVRKYRDFRFHMNWKE